MKHYATDGTVVLIFPSANTRDTFTDHDRQGFNPIESDKALELIASKLFIVTDFTKEA